MKFFCIPMWGIFLLLSCPEIYRKNDTYIHTHVHQQDRIGSWCYLHRNQKCNVKGTFKKGRVSETQAELRIRKYKGEEKKSRAGRLNKMIVVCTVDVLDDLGKGRCFFNKHVRQSITRWDRICLKVTYCMWESIYCLRRGRNVWLFRYFTSLFNS